MYRNYDEIRVKIDEYNFFRLPLFTNEQQIWKFKLMKIR